MGEGKQLDAKAVRLELTVPCDTRFRPVLSTICERMAEYVGTHNAKRPILPTRSSTPPAAYSTTRKGRSTRACM